MLTPRRTTIQRGRAIRTSKGESLSARIATHAPWAMARPALWGKTESGAVPAWCAHSHGA